MDTGNDATIAFTTQGFAAAYAEIGELDQQGGSLVISDLTTNGADKKMPKDTYDGGREMCRFYWDPREAPPGIHVKDTITITYPTLVAGNTPATLAGTGWVVRRKFPSLQNNEINFGEFEIEWETEPVYTPEELPGP